eukprot:11520571-Alexandrium_andersonii.AAC.1
MAAEALKVKRVFAAQLNPSSSAIHPEANGAAVVGWHAVSALPLRGTVREPDRGLVSCPRPGRHDVQAAAQRPGRGALGDAT